MSDFARRRARAELDRLARELKPTLGRDATDADTPEEMARRFFALPESRRTSAREILRRATEDDE